MATVIDCPPQVLAAAAMKLKTDVGAFLWMSDFEFPCLIGRVFMDRSGRFLDGLLIRTSQIMSLTEEYGYSIAHTFSGSHYLLVHPAGNPFSGQSGLRLSTTGASASVH
ncbi:hypothetical protein [Pseudomonas syringae]|uniref:hypothetical protein n=1 Tax=Pseudomonas syringae TaxID=317 RepID=UPI000D8709C7|nr:hypothetical protein [Pseudomonas syringae]PYD08970.1 hypothetical protein DND62_24445 [Pseudomonas syringae pv. pisi]PYD24492.1 hypothetical protein DND58_27730 [Pseudomonas syringae pv. pisi]PYD32337.1 hypothetical protein DND67_14335 [Pseudomonas syringae pv. pisi]RMM23577.1 hypothetical protein ALQ82_200103 [Pseudomonas syringae pv. pisi]